MSADIDLRASGHSVGAMLATLTGDVSARVQDGAVSGFGLAALASALAVDDANQALGEVRQALLPSGTAFSTLDLRLGLKRGSGALEGRLVAGSGEAELRGNIDFPAHIADLRVALRPQTPLTPEAAAALPEIGLRIAGPFGALVRTPELASVSRWLALRPPPETTP